MYCIFDENIYIDTRLTTMNDHRCHLKIIMVVFVTVNDASTTHISTVQEIDKKINFLYQKTVF